MNVFQFTGKKPYRIMDNGAIYRLVSYSFTYQILPIDEYDAPEEEAARIEKATGRPTIMRLIPYRKVEPALADGSDIDVYGIFTKESETTKRVRKVASKMHKSHTKATTMVRGIR